MPEYKIMLCRYPYGGSESMESVDWMLKTTRQITDDRRFRLFVNRVNDTPITMTRNQTMEDAKQQGMDFMLIVDSDMAPDCEAAEDPAAKPFWKSSIEFMLKHEGPCVVAAPYCGPPPFENVYVFQWTRHETGTPDPQGELVQYTREQAACMAGIQEAAALPTGLMLIDLRALQCLPFPYTYYEFKGDGPACQACGVRTPGPQAEKASTEDVTFTRDLSLAGVPVYCNWDAWAGHIKRKIVRKPRPYTADAVAARMHKAISERRSVRDSMIQVQKGGLFDAEVAKALADAEKEEVLPTEIHPPRPLSTSPVEADLFAPFDPMNPRSLGHAEHPRPEPGTGGGPDAARAG